MIKKVKTSLSKINYKLFLALLVLGFAPTIYTTVRVFFLGQLPGEWSFSIAGQLSWVNLLYEILNEAIILPLFYLPALGGFMSIYAAYPNIRRYMIDGKTELSSYTIETNYEEEFTTDTEAEETELTPPPPEAY